MAEFKKYKQFWGKQVRDIPVYHLLLIVLWIVIQVILFLKFGIVTDGEAEKYLSESDLLITEQKLSSNQFILYGSYIIYVTFCKLLGFSVFGIYILQTLFSGISLIVFYHICKGQVKNTLSATLAVCLLIVCIPYQSWNNHLYTESFFLSLQLTFLFFYFKYGIKNLGTWLILLLFLFSRPTAILSITAVLIHAAYSHYLMQKITTRLILLTSISILCIFLLINSFLSIGGSFDFKKPFVEGNVICYIPSEISIQPDTSGITNPNTLQGIGKLIIKNPAFFSQLFLKRSSSYFGLTRDHFSKRHNLLLIGFFYPLYLIAAIALIFVLRTNKPLLIFILSFLSLFWGSVLLTCDDWLNRFFMPIIPILILTSASLFAKREISH